MRPYEEAGEREARVREWESMPAAQLKGAVWRLWMGAPYPFLSADDFVDGLSGRYGSNVCRRFEAARADGITIPPVPPQAKTSFLCSCVSAGSFDLIDRLLRIPEQTLSKVFALDKRGWMERLATTDGGIDTGTSQSLFLLARFAAPSEVEGLFDLALNHFPEHPDIAEVLALGGPMAAILAKAVMNHHVDAASAQERLKVTPPVRRSREV